MAGRHRHVFLILDTVKNNETDPFMNRLDNNYTNSILMFYRLPLCLLYSTSYILQIWSSIIHTKRRTLWIILKTFKIVL